MFFLIRIRLVTRLTSAIPYKFLLSLPDLFNLLNKFFLLYITTQQKHLSSTSLIQQQTFYNYFSQLINKIIFYLPSIIHHYTNTIIINKNYLTLRKTCWILPWSKLYEIQQTNFYFWSFNTKNIVTGKILCYRKRLNSFDWNYTRFVQT